MHYLNKLEKFQGTTLGEVPLSTLVTAKNACSYLILMVNTCAPATTKSKGEVEASFTDDSARTTISCVLRMPSITFIMESGRVGMTLSPTVASGSDSSSET